MGTNSFPQAVSRLSGCSLPCSMWRELSRPTAFRRSPPPCTESARSRQPPTSFSPLPIFNPREHQHGVIMLCALGEFWVNVRLVDPKPRAIVNPQTPIFIPEPANAPIGRARKNSGGRRPSCAHRSAPPIRLAHQRERRPHPVGVRLAPASPRPALLSDPRRTTNDRFSPLTPSKNATSGS